MLRRLIPLALSVAAFTLVAGCESEGPAEQAGERVDEAVESASEALEEAGEQMEDKLEEAGDKVEEKTD
jgi:hypothetical protein